MHQIRFSRAYSDPPDIAGFKGQTSKGRGGLFAADLTRGDGNTDVFAPGGKHHRTATALCLFLPLLLLLLFAYFYAI